MRRNLCNINRQDMRLHSLARVQTPRYPATLQGDCAYTPHTHARASCFISCTSVCTHGVN